MNIKLKNDQNVNFKCKTALVEAHTLYDLAKRDKG